MVDDANLDRYGLGYAWVAVGAVLPVPVPTGLALGVSLVPHHVAPCPRAAHGLACRNVWFPSWHDPNVPTLRQVWSMDLGVLPGNPDTLTHFEA